MLMLIHPSAVQRAVFFSPLLRDCALSAPKLDWVSYSQDRNGLRPGRFYITKDFCALVGLAFETLVTPINGYYFSGSPLQRPPTLPVRMLISCDGLHRPLPSTIPSANLQQKSCRLGSDRGPSVSTLSRSTPRSEQAAC